MLAQEKRKVSTPAASTVRFVRDIPGFSGIQHYKILEPAEGTPFYRLMPDSEEFSFLLLHTFDYFGDYDFELPKQEQDLLQLNKESKILVFSIVNWGSGLKAATVNLKAPIVVNPANGSALQIILDTEMYKVKEPLLPAIMKSR
ncbi:MULTISPECIES: flagellar assembly protein FliW [Brevibacillus]|uniref:flagellar assembly protein FliW n=1 Tax=Brevibacillus TaxID=55080 RepID=UPI000F0A3790|nr:MULTISPECIES: flagellar assembly protein FliW [Brevibacillus]MDR7317981.1 flagellar assembly factor FliW [Brevibacillus nitrificans]MEC2130558.1 flagellar assembly protein FliW [Brevibacillus centrosporus]RNB68840.1 flagellar assembly protein FliW [Brevibacillus centrosporus]GED33878.1 flagellar assembly factor FliW [Brevibacillus centrosporus]